MSKPSFIFDDKFVADILEDWDLSADALAYEFNNKAHKSTGCIPFELTVIRMPPHLFPESYEPSGREAPLTRSQCLSNLWEHIGQVPLHLCKAQRRYKRNFDVRLQNLHKDIAIDGYKFLHVEKFQKSLTRRNKLAPAADGSL